MTMSWQVGIDHAELISHWTGYGELYDFAKAHVAGLCEKEPKYKLDSDDPATVYISRQGCASRGRAPKLLCRVSLSCSPPLSALHLIVRGRNPPSLSCLLPHLAVGLSLLQARLCNWHGLRGARG